MYIESFPIISITPTLISSVVAGFIELTYAHYKQHPNAIASEFPPGFQHSATPPPRPSAFSRFLKKLLSYFLYVSFYGLIWVFWINGFPDAAILWAVGPILGTLWASGVMRLADKVVCGVIEGRPLSAMMRGDDMGFLAALRMQREEMVGVGLPQ
ncbi:hypothetical protein BZA77DRAFT_369108 [Pyronema omphalodes]|nr:hypothetical protein BZA77DRAFT_369108 [Pyronema omphalodes]